jgi:hypothetical protein
MDEEEEATAALSCEGRRDDDLGMEAWKQETGGDGQKHQRRQRRVLHNGGCESRKRRWQPRMTSTTNGSGHAGGGDHEQRRARTSSATNRGNIDDGESGKPLRRMEWPGGMMCWVGRIGEWSMMN